MTKEQLTIKHQAVDQIKTVYDPEIPVNIFELGLVYEVTVKEGNDVHVLMTLTAPACPAAEIIPEEVKEKVGQVEGVKEVEVEITFEPEWNMDMMSDEAKLELGYL
ncbi:MAG: iron-sulfur cluster assembly protein [Bacteroidota bacterium]